MSTATKRLYEGLFLVDSGEAAADWDGINDTIKKTLARGDGQIVSMKKWDERRLAYDIGGKSRGTYILTYFQGDPDKITAIERTVQLSERIMRVIIIRTDKMSTEDMEKAPPAATETTKVAAKLARAGAVRASAAKTERGGGARASKKAGDQKPERAKAKAPRGSSAKRSRGPRGGPKSAQGPEGSAQPESGQAKE